jgi:peptidoglycan LD-endopeptidase CwlK
MQQEEQNKAVIRFVDESTRRINTLDPRLIEPAMRIFQTCLSEKIPIYITWGGRTVDEQNLLFKYGRTLPGPIMTCRRGGYSAHNFGLALDFCLTTKDKLLVWEDVYEDPKWRKKWFRIVELFELEGWESGWRWPSFEPSHVQNLLGHTIGDLHNIYRQDENRNNGNKDL